MWIINAVALTIVIVSCLGGIFAPSRYYDDTLLQRVGMCGVMLFCLPRLLQILQTQSVTSTCMSYEAQLLGHVGMACYCIGTAIKIWRPMRIHNQRLDRRAADSS